MIKRRTALIGNAGENVGGIRITCVAGTTNSPQVAELAAYLRDTYNLGDEIVTYQALTNGEKIRANDGAKEYEVNAIGYNVEGIGGRSLITTLPIALLVPSAESYTWHALMTAIDFDGNVETYSYEK